MRSLFFAQDFVGGADLGATLVKRFPQSRELAAWHLANAARADGPDEAIVAAEEMIRANPADPWGWFVKSIAIQYVSDAFAGPVAISAGLEAFRRAPTNPDAAWARASAMINNRQAGAAATFLDSISATRPLSPTLECLRADALFTSGNVSTKRDQSKIDSAFATYARVREHDTLNASAFVDAADQLLRVGRIAEAYDLARRAVVLWPSARSAHQSYWRAIGEQKERADVDRNAEVVADIEGLLRARGGSPIVLYIASNQYGALGMLERQRELQERVLREFPASASAEWVEVIRIRAIGSDRREGANRDAVLTARKRALIGFINRPIHKRSSLLGEAYMSLGTFADSTMSADSVLLIARGRAAYEQLNPNYSFAVNAIQLVSRGPYFREAERIARDGIAAGRKYVDLVPLGYETVGDHARARDEMDAQMYDALGWVFFREGRLTESESQLEHAHDLDPKSPRVLYHLGQLAESRGRAADAESYYIKGTLAQNFGTGGESRTALAKLYEKRTGSTAGYDKYLAGIEDTDRRTRKAAIEKTRLADAKRLPPFSLKTLGGHTITLDSLEGKVTVINNWGMWCGPCVAEMPEFQKLATKYASDPDVRVLTIDNDKDVAVLREWMKKKGYTFEALIDDGYVARSGIASFPTTWFLDRGGRVAFAKSGYSEKLVEEFSWRIETLRGEKARP